MIAGLIVLVSCPGPLGPGGWLGKRWPSSGCSWWAAVMIYSFWLILTTAAFWVVRIDEMANLFQGVFAAGRYPVGIYPGWLKNGLTFLVPSPSR